MTEIKIKYQNDTDSIDCALTDNSGIALSLALYTNIYVYLRHTECNYEAARYAMNASVGYDHLNFHVDSIPGGTFHIDVENSVILAMKKGLYKIVIEFLLIDADFAGGYQVETLEEVYLERR